MSHELFSVQVLPLANEESCRLLSLLPIGRRRKR